MSRQTQHDIHFCNAQDMSELDDDSVELVVTSPPYPMIEMWDELFSGMNDEIGECLSSANSREAFELMHEELDAVWSELERVLVPGGIACINIGDATRKPGDSFELFPNHARITQAFRERGFTMLPSIQWRKPTNKGTKFMGSGMLPPNAYVTLEHEHVLIFRNGTESRDFESKSERRYRSAYFWEERNQWYSDVWVDIGGERQDLVGKDARERSAAYPVELPYRLINMYSVQGDTVLDPFWGTGTTTIAAMMAARNSAGYELNQGFLDVFEKRVDALPQLVYEKNQTRLQQHKAFVQESDNEPEYVAEHYDTRVMTQQEKELKLWDVKTVVQDGSLFSVEHEQFEEQRSSHNTASQDREGS